MKNLKRIAATGLCVSMLLGAFAAAETPAAETGAVTAQDTTQNGQNPNGMNGRQPPALPNGGGQGQNSNGMNGQQPPALPNGGGQGQNPDGMNGQQPPALPNGSEQGQNPDGMNGQQPPSPVTVQTGNNAPLRMREDPSKRSRIVDSFENGTEVRILEVGEEWVKVQVGDKTGYMMVQFLEGDVETAAAAETTGTESTGTESTGTESTETESAETDESQSTAAT